MVVLDIGLIVMKYHQCQILDTYRVGLPLDPLKSKPRECWNKEPLHTSSFQENSITHLDVHFSR